MNRGVMSLLLLAAAALAVCLGIANRGLANRLSRAEESLRQLQQQLERAKADAETPQVRHFPRRLAPLPSPAPPGPDAAPEENPPSNAAPPAPETTSSEPPMPIESRTVVRVTEPVAVASPIVPVPGPGPVPDPDWVRYYARQGSHLVLEGMSGSRYWLMETKIVSGQIAISPALDFDHRIAIAEFPTNLPCTATLVIPISSLKCNVRDVDAAARVALAASEFPVVRYELRELFFKEASTNDASPMLFWSVGDLTVHGATKAIEMPVSIQLQSNGDLAVSGLGTIKLPEFGIKPDRPIVPANPIRTPDEVKITLAWKLRRVSGTKGGS